MYTLNINFTSEDLNAIASKGLKLVIAKPENGQQPNITWQVITPLQINSIAWNEAYGIYISFDNLYKGRRIFQMANTPLGPAMNSVYTAESNGTISGPQGGGPGPFTLINHNMQQQSLVTGLYQNATVNGMDYNGQIVSAENCMSFANVVMSPGNRVYLWLQSNIDESTVVQPDSSAVSSFQFGNGVEKITIQYDGHSGKFVSVAKI